MSTEPQQIFLYVNGTLSSDQGTLNMVAGPGVTIIPRTGGSVLFSASGGVDPGTLSPYSGIPSGDIPGNTFTVPYTLVQSSVYVNGLCLLPTSYSQSGATFVLNESLVETDSIFIQGWYQP